MSEPRYVYKTTLKTVYGLSDRLIAMLGEPDKRVPNPHYRSGPQSSLYAIPRVERFVEDHADAVAAHQERRAMYQARANAVYARQREEVMRYAETTPIRVTRTFDSLDHLRLVADRFYPEGLLSDGGLVPFLRHNATTYEKVLDHLDIAFRVGRFEAYLRIKERANEVADRILDGLAAQEGCTGQP